MWGEKEIFFGASPQNSELWIQTSNYLSFHPIKKISGCKCLPLETVVSRWQRRNSTYAAAAAAKTQRRRKTVIYVTAYCNAVQRVGVVDCGRIPICPTQGYRCTTTWFPILGWIVRQNIQNKYCGKL